MKSYPLLKNINSPSDIKKISAQSADRLCSEIRTFLINTVSNTGGHLASNLGVVELTVAMHKIFNCPTDKIVWDVGHQSYVHKILTGRFDKFSTLRQEGGISGFPRPCESEYDAFISGHSSTSISVASGIATANRLSANPGYAIAVIGDGAITGGLAYEAFNNAARNKKDRLIIVLNDNNMSISKNVGSVANYLSGIRNTPQYYGTKDTVESILDSIPLIGKSIKNVASAAKKTVKDMLYSNAFFEDLGFVFLGPVNGHDLNSLCSVFRRARDLKCPVVISVNTKKGKGYKFAEENPGEYHGISRFNIKTGLPYKVSSVTYSAVFGKKLVELASNNRKICAVTAAMKYGTELQHFYRRFKDRFFDVGIAEAHAVVFSSALAAGGMIPVFAVYSSFLQRGYDQIIHDASIDKKHVILAIDRAGIVGDDGETHQGIFDVAFLSSIPGAVIYSPANYTELEYCLELAVTKHDGVVAVRYPRGGQPDNVKGLSFTGTHTVIHSQKTSKIALVTYGRLFSELVIAKKQLEDVGVSVDIIKLNLLAPLPNDFIETIERYENIIFVEEGISVGGIAQQVASKLMIRGYKGRYISRAIENFVPQADVSSSIKNLGLDSESIAELAKWVV